MSYLVTITKVDAEAETITNSTKKHDVIKQTFLDSTLLPKEM
jgi:hypothetical protein